MTNPSQPRRFQLDVEKILKLADEGGLLSLSLKGFEPRQQQRNMMQNVIEAYNSNRIALIEAGTGTGKSIAYLLPSLLWAAQAKERTVISTNTINLQEQLIHKDLPHLIKALNLDLKPVLVKGMGNYLCLRKLEEAHAELTLYPSEEDGQINTIASWSRTTQEGSRSELPFLPSPAAWERVCAESDACPNKKCHHYQNCFFFKARRQAQDAQILVANHHLLLTDLATRADLGNYEDPCLLPAYTRIILDEAHHLEELATDHFAGRINRIELNKILSKLASDKQGEQQGKLRILKEKIQSLSNKIPRQELISILDLLSTDLPALRHRLLDEINRAFDGLSVFVETLKSPREQNVADEFMSEKKLRLLEAHQSHPMWQNEILPLMKWLINSLTEYFVNLISLEKKFEFLDYEALQEQTKSIRLDIQASASKIEGAIVLLKNFISPLEDKSKVRWIETQKIKQMLNVHLIDADLNIAKNLANYLFGKFPTVVLCSATLTANKQFGFIRQRFGLTKEYLPQKETSEHIYDSPFNYGQQALLAVPTDMPPPSHFEFNSVAFESIWKAIEVSRGHAFVLFTSYSMLKQCADALNIRLMQNRYPLFKQGDDNRRNLLDKFKKSEKGVLFGTDSFWEGVDVAGDALRCVIIVKLPFRVPTEPIIQARTEAILEKGGDPFTEYSIPQAVVKFKQGFGRLIRNRWDRGCIVCLDTRLVKKNYGHYFLNSLPPCEKVFMNSDLVWQKMADFYRRTYHLVKQNPFS